MAALRKPKGLIDPHKLILPKNHGTHSAKGLRQFHDSIINLIQRRKSVKANSE